MKMEKICFRSLLVLMILILIPLPGIGSSAQDTLWNQTDAQGRKQGHWKKYHPGGELRYRGFFVDDRPWGKMQRFYEDGKLQADLFYSENGETAQALLYFRNGKLGAVGKYSGQNRDSIWCYYSYYTGTLSYRESYVQGRKEGPSEKFYPEGPRAELLYWENDMRHGRWEQFYEDSTLRLSAAYVMDQLNGPYRIFLRDGTVVLEGTYILGKKDGDWNYYDNEGNLKHRLIYLNGEIQNEKELEQWAKEYMDEIEENLGTIPEPDLENFFDRTP